MGGEQFSLRDGVWNLANEQMTERNAQAFLRVDDGCKFRSNFARASLMLAL
jgi:hypothetical protein